MNIWERRRMLDRGKVSDNAASHGVFPPLFPQKGQRPDRGPPTQSLCHKENRSQSSFKGSLGQVQLQLPTGIPLWWWRYQAWERNNPRLVLEDSIWRNKWELLLNIYGECCLSVDSPGAGDVSSSSVLLPSQSRAPLSYLLSCSWRDIHHSPAPALLGLPINHALVMPVSPGCYSVVKSCLTLCDPLGYSIYAPLSFNTSWSFLRFMSVESVMSSSHLILFHPLLLLTISWPLLNDWLNPVWCKSCIWSYKIEIL